jgi:hypothetical protein
MTLLSDLIEIPEQVHKSDFVISLATAIGDPARTVADYVVTPQLAECFDTALSLVTSSIADHRSKATYLHASFGAGKTAMMSVLHLLLQGDPVARSIPELGSVVGKYADRIDGRKFLLVPFHFVGRASMEQEVLGGYVEHIRAAHPGAPLPSVYVADGILDEAQNKRRDQGDDVFFRILSEGEVADEWGDYGAAWDGARFDSAMAAPPGSPERDLLVGALLRTHERALPGQAHATADGFVPLDAGLDAISRHAKSLGYDAVILFLDELVLWLAARMSDVAFVSREGAKVVNLVEADAAKRPAPIISFIARQRDLRELVGEHVPGAQSLTAIDILRHSEGRFGTITLEDRNLPLIAQRRLLKPRSEAARQQLDDTFDAVRRQLEQRDERDVLLTESGDLDAFRRLYPFSPALVDALVALSGAMQRERTALKVMLQLLVEGRDHLELGQIIPLGDLFDAVNSGDEPLTEVMRSQFAQARRLWTNRFQPMLLREHGLTEATAESVPVTHGYVTDGRLIKTLLIAALVPEVGPLRALTVSRLTALNSGIVRSFVPGAERQQVLDRLRRWAAEVGELRLGEDDQDPTVAVQLSGIDTGPILDAAKVADNEGERRRKIRELLQEALAVRDAGSMDPYVEVVWRGTRRKVSVTFANVRDEIELPDEMLRAGLDPRFVIDLPLDLEGFGPSDDRGRAMDYRRDRNPEWTAVWLPNFLTAATLQLLGKLVRLDHILTGETFERLASYLAPNDRPAARAQLANEQAAVRERLRLALLQAYGVDSPQDGVVEAHLDLGEQFIALDPALNLQPPVGTSLRSHAEALADQLLRFRFPKHPEYTDLVTRAERVHTLGQVELALQQKDGRLENVDAAMRKVLTKVAGPLGLGTMYQAHFIADLSTWSDLIRRRQAEGESATLTIGLLRRWLDAADLPSERRGMLDEDADLVILAVAAASNWALLSSGSPVTKPELGRLQADWQLAAQDLPSDDAWATARSRGADIGVVAASTLRSATTVADLSQKVVGRLVEDGGQAVRDLVPQIEAAAARLGVVADGDRFSTARAGVALVEALRRQPERAAEVLARATVPTSMAALGTSIVQSAEVTKALQEANWDLLRAATELGDASLADADAIKARLVDALVADELAVGLVGRLRDAVTAATQLLARAAKSGEHGSGGTTQVTLPTGASFTGEPGTGVLSIGSFDKAEAERHLERVRERLRSEAHLDLTWQIEELPDDAS